MSEVSEVCFRSSAIFFLIQVWLLGLEEDLIDIFLASVRSLVGKPLVLSYVDGYANTLIFLYLVLRRLIFGS